MVFINGCASAIDVIISSVGVSSCARFHHNVGFYYIMCQLNSEILQKVSYFSVHVPASYETVF